jgi:cytochrome c
MPRRAVIPIAAVLAVLLPTFAGVDALAQSRPSATARAPWADIGRPATTSEIRAWDIDVRSDFKGLPPGSGSVAKGQDVWEAKCASCHGVFGESNEVFTPIAGGTTPEDVKTGRVANLLRPDFPQRTTLMKLSQVSTLWDYVNRAMPWNAPKSLTTDEVYAVVAYMLNLGNVIPDDFVLSDKTMAAAQARLPNRNGKVLYRGLWAVDGKPDVQGETCMRDCRRDVTILSSLPDYARDAHGNLAEQQRVVGPLRGADTTKPPLREPWRVAVAKGQVAPAVLAHDRSPLELAREANCIACHGVDKRMVGPSLREVATRYKGDAGAPDALFEKVKQGGVGTWGTIPMPPHPQLPDDRIRTIIRWILAGAT